VLDHALSPKAGADLYGFLAKPITDHKAVKNAYAVAVVPPELLSEEMISEAEREMARRWAYDASFVIPGSATPALEIEPFIDGNALGRIELALNVGTSPVVTVHKNRVGEDDGRKFLALVDLKLVNDPVKCGDFGVTRMDQLLEAKNIDVEEKPIGHRTHLRRLARCDPPKFVRRVHRQVVFEKVHRHLLVVWGEHSVDCTHARINAFFDAHVGVRDTGVDDGMYLGRTQHWHIEGVLADRHSAIASEAVELPLIAGMWIAGRVEAESDGRAGRVNGLALPGEAVRSPIAVDHVEEADRAAILEGRLACPL
jgi:hypothetical protein